MARWDDVHRRSAGILLLAIEKSIAAVFFLIASVVLFVLEVKGITHPLQNLFAAELSEDPHDLLANLLIQLVPQVSRALLSTLLFISMGYFALHCIEAIGLWLNQLWVEYLVLVETTALLPYEVYEMVRQPTPFKLGLFVVNLAIVLYLAGRSLKRLRPVSAV